MANIWDFDRILKTDCNLQHFTRSYRIKNLDDLERDEADVYLRRAGVLDVKEWPFATWLTGNVFERRESRCCWVLMKHGRKVKSEQVITLQMPQQLKNY